ncbi:MBG domain-containing protein, partial [Celerinatantimonas diazotrophica]
NASGGTFNPANYTITYVPGKLTVDKAPLTVTANDASKTFNGLAYKGGNGVTYSGLVNNETGSVIGGTLTYGGSSQGAVNVGNYTIDVSGLTSGNYAISYVPGQLNVTAPPSAQPNASLSVNAPTLKPVQLFASAGSQLVTYPAGSIETTVRKGAGTEGASATGANTNGQGDIMSTQDIHLSGAVCFSGSDNAISCSAN